MIRTSARYGRLPGFPLAEMKATRARLQAQGVDVIDLGAGDSGLAPPPAAVARLQEVVRDPSYSSYPFQRGLPEFREAVARWMGRRFGLEVDPWRNLLPLVGSKDGIAHLPFAFMDPGDAAIIPDPGYTPYVGGVTLAGGDPHLVALRPEHDFLIPLEAVPDQVAARTRILYLNYPNNPTAATAPDAYYRQAIDFCRERGALLVHDHAYSELAFDGYKPRSIFEFDGAWDVAIEIHSMSKTYNMTGWRIGWAVANPEIISALQTVKTFVDTGQFLAVQAGAAAALDTGADWVPGNVEVFRRRRDALAASLRESGFHVDVPKATMYLWVPVPEGLGSSEAFGRRALEEQGVIVLPGATLGAGGEGFFRMAFTCPEDRLAEAGRRLGALL